MAFPWQENLRQIRDPVTNRTFTCTAKELDLPMEWRASVVPVAGREGGYNALKGGRSYLGTRTVTATLIRVYQGADSFKTVMRELEIVLNPGHELELTFVEEDGVEWFWTGVICTRFDKRETMAWRGFCEIPLTFLAPDPRQRAQYKPGVPLLDDGRFLDDNWYLDEDPDTYPLSGSSSRHVITNPGSAADEAPVVTLHGPIVGPVACTYTDDAGNTVTWRYAGGVAAGEILTVDSAQPEVVSSNPAVDAYSLFAPGPGQDSYGRIAVGDNTVDFAYTAAGSGASASIAWTPRK